MHKSRIRIIYYIVNIDRYASTGGILSIMNSMLSDMAQDMPCMARPAGSTEE